MPCSQERATPLDGESGSRGWLSGGREPGAGPGWEMPQPRSPTRPGWEVGTAPRHGLKFCFKCEPSLKMRRCYRKSWISNWIWENKKDGATMGHLLLITAVWRKGRHSRVVQSICTRASSQLLLCVSSLPGPTLQPSKCFPLVSVYHVHSILSSITRGFTGM